MSRKIVYIRTTVLLIILAIVIAYIPLKKRKREKKNKTMECVYHNLTMDEVFTFTDFIREGLEGFKKSKGNYPEDPSKVSFMHIDSIYGDIPYGGNETAVEIHNDPFIRKKDVGYKYLSNGEYYFLISSGPDKEYELEKWKEIDRQMNERDELDEEYFNRINAELAYDPTNGVISGGDIFITSDNPGNAPTRMTRYLIQSQEDRGTRNYHISPDNLSELNIPQDD